MIHLCGAAVHRLIVKPAIMTAVKGAAPTFEDGLRSGGGPAEEAELPLWASANVPGGDERNAALRERYAGRVPPLALGAG